MRDCPKICVNLYAVLLFYTVTEVYINLEGGLSLNDNLT